MLRFLWVIVLFFLIGYGCGYKTPPLPFESVLPPSVNDLVGEVRFGKIFLTWTMPDKRKDGDPITKFRLFTGIFPKDEFCMDCPPKFNEYREIDMATSKEFVITNNIATFEFGTPKVGKIYVFSIQLIDSAGRFSKKGNTAKVLVDVLPDRISCLTAKQGGDKIILSWQPLSLPRICYNIYRKDQNTPFTLIHSSAAGENNYEDKDIIPETRYGYKITALHREEEYTVEGEASPEVWVYFMDKVPPHVPEGLFAVCTSGGVVLRWDEVKDHDLAGYNIYRFSSRDSQPKQINLKPIQVPYFRDTQVLPGIIYHYSVSAVDRAQKPNESQKSKYYAIRCE